jgi:hypothetical protein
VQRGCGRRRRHHYEAQTFHRPLIFVDFGRSIIPKWEPAWLVISVCTWHLNVSYKCISQTHVCLLYGMLSDEESACMGRILSGNICGDILILENNVLKPFVFCVN